MADSPSKPLDGRFAIPLVIATAGFFNAAFFTRWSFLIFGYVCCLLLLARLSRMRHAFYAGFAVGFLGFAPQLGFFWGVFGAFGAVLWAILAFWIGLFVALTHAGFRRFGGNGMALFAPLLWTGLEYFRSELYYLRFAWLGVGYALGGGEEVGFCVLGVYGIGFILVALAAYIFYANWKYRFVILLLFLIAAGLLFPNFGGLFAMRHVKVVGVQMEFPSADEVISNLDKLVAAHPDTELFVLSEYTFESTAPPVINAWCRDHQKYLVVGAIDPAGGGNYYDTAFVIGPDGKEVFKQGKSVPIQFFRDGLPAPEQKVWDSPWGKIGICICYDLSYTRVTDSLVRLGAQGLIVPTMDVESWGKHEHELHERVARIRAAEYGIPIFRVASSGISQLVNRSGAEVATAPFAGSGATVAGDMTMPNWGGRIPWDRSLAWLSVTITSIFVLWLVIESLLRRFGMLRLPDKTAPETDL